MDERNIQEVFAKAQQREAEAWGLFEQKFEKQYPAPREPNVRLMEAIGWQFIATTIQAVSSVVLASLRTAQMFYDAAAGAFWLFQYLEAGASILAIELGIVIFSTIKSEMKNRAQSVNDLSATLDVSVKLLNAGIIAGLIISAIAGLGVSLEGFGIPVQNFKLVLAITMGLGASVIAWVSGDILGAMLARFGNARLIAGHEYSQELQKRGDLKNSLWEKAPERKIAISELTELKALLDAQRRQNVPMSPRQVPAPQPEPRKTPTRPNEVRNAIYEYLDSTYAMEQRVAGPTELVTEKGVSKGYASDVIKAWRFERNIPTSESTENAP